MIASQQETASRKKYWNEENAAFQIAPLTACCTKENYDVVVRSTSGVPIFANGAATAAFASIVAESMAAGNDPNYGNVSAGDGPRLAEPQFGTGSYRNGVVTMDETLPDGSLHRTASTPASSGCNYCYDGYLRGVNTGVLMMAPTSDILARDYRRNGARNRKIATAVALMSGGPATLGVRASLQLYSAYSLIDSGWSFMQNPTVGNGFRFGVNAFTSGVSAGAGDTVISLGIAVSKSEMAGKIPIR